MNRVITMLGVIVLALAIIFRLVSLGGDITVLLVAIGALLVGVGVLVGQ